MGEVLRKDTLSTVPLCNCASVPQDLWSTTQFASESPSLQTGDNYHQLWSPFGKGWMEQWLPHMPAFPHESPGFNSLLGMSCEVEAENPKRKSELSCCLSILASKRLLLCNWSGKMSQGNERQHEQDQYWICRDKDNEGKNKTIPQTFLARKVVHVHVLERASIGLQKSTRFISYRQCSVTSSQQFEICKNDGIYTTEMGKLYKNRGFWG